MDPVGNHPRQLGTESSSGYFTARHSAPRASESAESLIRRFNECKLETEFGNGYVVHTTCEWKHLSSDRAWKRSKWDRKKKIGAGGFGEVWLQEKEAERGGGSGEVRAVKTISRDSLPDVGQSQELLALVKLDEYYHLFVQFLGWYENEYNVFLVMEYVELGDLASCERTWAKAEAKEIMRQILDGLVVLHQKGICHRDLKPQNILIASLDPVWIKITDFGISKELLGTVARTQAGTRGYCAPEVDGLVPREFKRGFVPHSLDIWSLGALLHELFTSETPFLEHFSDEDLESGIDLEPGVDLAALYNYCLGLTEFPIGALQRSELCEQGIVFIKRLLTANPKARPTATLARQDPWLTRDEYTSIYVQKLLSEFSCLAIDIDIGTILIKQLAKLDIMKVLPTSAKADISSLVIAAMQKGCDLVVSRLLESPNFDLESVTKQVRGELFRLAAESREPQVMRTLIQRGLHFGALVGDRTVLQWAIESGDVKTVNHLLEVIYSGSDELLLAVKLGNLSMVNVLMQRTEDSNSPLVLEAAQDSGHSEIFRRLLNDRSDVKKSRSDGRTLLQVAVEGRQIDIAGLLLKYGADVNKPTSHGRTLLQVAVDGGEIDMITLLLEAKANVNAIVWCEGVSTVLQIAAAGGKIDIVKLLLSNNANVNAEAARKYGMTALQAAAEGGHLDIVKLLLDNNADVNAEAAREYGITALQAAARGGHLDIVKLLLNNNANANAGAVWPCSMTALQAAAKGGYLDIVKLLLNNNANVNAEAAPEYGMTALQAAAKGGYLDIVKLLLDNNADVNAEAAREYGTALQVAAEGGHFDTVKLLLDNNADVNAEAAGIGGCTALQAAARGGHLDIVKLLLDNNANVNAGAVWLYGMTALQAAAKGGYLDIVKLLLDNNADVNAEAAGKGGRTALQAAAEGRHFDTVKLLLDKNANVNAEAAWRYGITALQAAAKGGHLDIVKLLLDNNANVNAKAAWLYGITALQAAATGGHLDIVKLLLDNKANVDAENNGHEALGLAATNGHTHIVKFLKAKYPYLKAR